jgi:hypothetical protein
VLLLVMLVMLTARDASAASLREEGTVPPVAVDEAHNQPEAAPKINIAKG